MLKFLDIHYHFYNSKNPHKTIEKYGSNFGFLYHLPKTINVNSIFQLSISGKLKLKDVNFIFFKGKPLNKFEIPFSYNKFINTQKADYILIHGLRYGVYSCFLKSFLKKKPITMVQVHGFAPSPSGIKKIIYKFLNKYIDGYLFTGKDNAIDWIDKGIFSNGKIYEVMEGSTNFTFDACIKKKSHSYLWVGRLNENKDPLTIIDALELFLLQNPKASLTMIYQENDLLNAINNRLLSSKKLKNAVKMVGKVLPSRIERYYQENQFFILGSHHEGSGYALVEAMACRCIPIVTKIPSYNFMTNNGECALLFSPGNKEELLLQLKQSMFLDINVMQQKIKNQFHKKLSFRAIAHDVYTAFEEIAKKKGYK
jgi:glycosyltransferase involved in cell wall biosynthesis